MAINRLTEDREELKIKLTLINNQNIELTQKLKRILNRKQTINESDRNSDQSIDWKTKCDELQAINEHLRQHLNTLKIVFNDFHNSSESTTNQTITTNNTSNNLNNTLVNENSTNSNIMTTNTTNNTIIGQNSSTSDENLTQNSKTPFDKWYNK
jgi:predicted nuclease with TOPRIM domain